MAKRLAFLICLALASWAGRASALEAVIGVNVTNAQNLTPTDRDAVLGQLKDAGVRVVRIPLAGDRSVEFIRRAAALGIRTVAIADLGFRPGALVRPLRADFPGMWAMPKLSDADPDRFEALFRPQLRTIDDLGLKLEAIELGNEINWTAFNGDFTVPGRGRSLTFEDLSVDPLGREVARGFRAYIAVAARLKAIRDSSTLNAHTPILLAGLSDADPVRMGWRLDVVGIQATIRYLRQNGIDSLVDAYAVHYYPANSAPDAAAGRRFGGTVLGECRPSGSGKPCWITEWGLQNRSDACPLDDERRAALARADMRLFGSYVRASRLVGIFYFDWRTDPDTGSYAYSVFRCGTLTPTGREVLQLNEPKTGTR